VIVGGGPAGLYAGLRLARQGHAVDLFEEHPQVGMPVHCTGVLAPEAFVEFGLRDDSVLNPLTTVRFVAPSGDVVEHSTAATEAVVIDRARFDQQLADQARQAGVRFHRGRVTAFDVGGAGVTVTVEGSTVAARAGVLACGANYSLQRRLGLGLPRLMLQTAQAEVPAGEIRPVEVHFGGEVAPGGFAWAVPVQRADRRFVRVGVMCDKNAGVYFRRMLQSVSGRWGIEPEGCVPRHKMLPLAPIKSTYGDRLVVLGDAAGLVKPTTGGGIYYSLVSAELASQTVTDALHADDLSARRLASYEKAWRSRLGSELRWQLILRRIAQRLSDRDIDALFDLAHTDGIMPLVRRTARFNRHREFIVALLKHPPARRVLFRAALA
jgi:geranylgeranyl reductase family protein